METFPRGISLCKLNKVLIKFYLEVSENAIVVVMGDIGQSPRMCYHALSLANHGLNVDLVGYLNSKPHEKIWSNNKIR